AIVEAPSGKLLLSNEQNASIFLQKHPSLQGVSEYVAYRGFHPDGREIQAHEWPLSRSILNGEIVRGEEIHIVRGDGSHGYIRCNSAPVRDEAGNTVAGVVTYDDVSRAKAAQAEREQLVEKLSETV